MKLQRLEFYQPSDLVKLLNESGATLKEVANATGIPYATLSNYRYGKTDSDSMPHRVVVELSNFFRSQQRMVVDVRLQQAIGLPEFYDNLNEIKDMFKYSHEVLEMYVLHEMLYRYYNLDSIDKFDDVLLFVSRNLSSFLMKYDVVHLGMIDDLKSKGCHFIFEYSEPSLPCVAYDVSHDAKILIPDDFNLIGNNKLKPLSATLHNKNLIFDYFVENVLFLKVNNVNGANLGIIENMVVNLIQVSDENIKDSEARAIYTKILSNLGEKELSSLLTYTNGIIYGIRIDPATGELIFFARESEDEKAVTSIPKLNFIDKKKISEKALTKLGESN